MNSNKEFYQSYYKERQYYFLEISEDSYGLNSDNYYEEVLKSTVTKNEEFRFIEKEISFKVPAELQSFYQCCYSLEDQIQFGFLEIPGNSKSKGLQPVYQFLVDNYEVPEMLKRNLFPFGTYNDSWYICLNCELEFPNILLFEHESHEVSHTQWFSNFDKFISCNIDFSISKDSSNFKKIDPKSNFKNAYKYW